MAIPVSVPDSIVPVPGIYLSSKSHFTLPHFEGLPGTSKEPDILALELQSMNLSSGTYPPPSPPSPINMLPFELLSKIMLLALGPRPPGAKPPRPADVLVLCEVCSRWRHVALQTPQLWSLFDLPILTWKPKQACAFAATARFLERSDPFPLNIRVVDCSFHEAPENVVFRDYRPELLAVSGAADRWQSLTVSRMWPWNTDMGSIMNPLACIPAGKLNHLEKLNLTLLHREISQHPNRGVFESAPCLRDVTLDMWDSLEIIPMPWAQLTQLTLKCASPQACLDALLQCKNVVTATIDSTKQWFSDVAVKPAVTLKNLEVLHIYMYVFSEGQDLEPFLRRLQLPGLKSLILSLIISDDVEWSTSWLVPDLQAFLTHSPNLEQLHLRDCISPDDIASVLSHTPFLRTLGFYDSQLPFDNDDPIDDEFFRALQYSETDKSLQLVPMLETLEVGDLFQTFTGSSVVEMIQSRGWSDNEDSQPAGVARLKCVSLHWSHMVEYWERVEVSDGFQELLWGYQERGLTLDGMQTRPPRGQTGE